MKKVVIYCRVACAKQSNRSAEVQMQEQAVRGYAEARGLAICKTYLDAGLGGAALERPALQKLLADCRTGNVATVITQDPERLSRNHAQLAELLLAFERAGVRVDFSTAAGKAQWEFRKAFWGAAAIRTRRGT